jgi:hypothetical protein
MHYYLTTIYLRALNIYELNSVSYIDMYIVQTIMYIWLISHMYSFIIHIYSCIMPEN